MTQQSANTMTLLGVGDIGPIHEPMDAYGVLAKDTLATGDFRIAQCERVYSDRGSLQVHSGGGHSRVKPHLASVFSDNGFDLVSVASNHAMDWGEEGLMDTIASFEERGIQAIGAGRNLAEARKPAIVERNGVRVAVLAYCSVLQAGYAAGPNKAGVAPLRAHTYYQQQEYQAGTPPKIISIPYEEDVAMMVEDIQAAREKADAVILWVHWGIHFIPKVIATYQPAIMKAAIDAGVDAVFGHHAHVPKAIEVYKGKPCFYSLSNFIMSAPEATPQRQAHFFEQYGVELDMEYPRLPYGPGAKRSMIAKAVIGTNGVQQTSFLPTLIDPQLRPEVLHNGDARFDDAVQYMEWASEGFNHKFTVHGDEVVVS